jgi:hypothetical protein
MNQASDYGYKIDKKFNKVYSGTIIKKIMGTIGNSPAEIGDKVAVSICLSPSDYNLVYGINLTTRGRDICVDFYEVKEYIKLDGNHFPDMTPDEVILDAINIHNKRVW